MRRSVIALAFAFALGSATASEKTDVLLTVQHWVAAANKGDMKGFVALCEEQSTIFDDFPPYEWHGVGACANWWRDNESLGKTEGITDASVVLGKPLQVYITGEHAYVVTRDEFVFKAKGKPMKQKGSIHTIILHKSNLGWRITGESWAATSLAAPGTAGAPAPSTQ